MFSPYMFDDFIGADASIWTPTGIVTYSDSIATIHSTSTGNVQLLSIVEYGSTIAFRCRANDTPGGAAATNIGFAENDWHSYAAFNGGYAGDANRYTVSADSSIEGAAVRTNNLGSDDNGYHIWEVARPSLTRTEFRIDNILRATHTDRNPDETVPIKLRTYATANYLYVDWALIRKYVASEPIAGTVAPTAINRALSRPMSKADLMRACCT